MSQETSEERDVRFERRLTAIDLTLEQKAFFRAVRFSRNSDDYGDIGARMDPPKTAGALRTMKNRLRMKYRKAKRFTNLYEEVVTLTRKGKEKDFQ